VAKLKEHGATVPLNNYPGNYLRGANPDANTGHGYGKLNGKMKPMPISATGFPYDLYELPAEGDEEEFEFGPETQKRFANKVGVHTSTDPHYVSRQGGDPFSFFDDSTVGLAGESLVRDCVKMVLEDIFRNRSRSSEPDGAKTQWGTNIPGGTQFGWSSGFNFKQDKEALKPVFSLRDLMTKHEDELDRTHGEMEPEPEQEWKEDWGEEEYEKQFPLFY
jgi:hypothetical protein